MAEPTLRETISSVLDNAEKTDAASPAPETPAPSSAPAEGAAPSVPPVGSQEAQAVPAKPEASAPAAPSDSGGKPPVDASKPVAPQAPKAPEPPKPTGLRPPESWKPGIKEHWKTLPPAVQAEIVRRERQVEGVMKDAAQNRQIAQGMGQLYGQFQDVFRAENTPPMQTLANLLNISRTLRSAPPPQRAQMMAQVISQYEIDLTLLDQALAYNVQHAPQRNGMQQFSQMVQQQLAPLHEQVRRLSQNQQHPQQNGQQDAALQEEVNAFAAKPENEYFEVLRDDIADILEGGARRGQKISLGEAYERAMLMNNDLAPLVAQRRLKEAAAAQNGPAAEAARRAGMSVTGAPAAGPIAGALDPSKSVRNAVELAFQQHSART